MPSVDLSEQALILAPTGRDADIAARMLGEAAIASRACPDVPCLRRELDAGAGLVIATEEAIARADMRSISAWLEAQPEWSDLPIILLTQRSGGLERNPAAARYLKMLGNVTFLERPFHPTTLISIAEAALRGRRRQYEARNRLELLRESENQFRTLADSIPTLCWTAAPDGSITWYNRRWYEYTGTTREIMIGWGWQTVVDADVMPVVTERWQASVASGKPFEMTFPLRGADGKYRAFLSRGLPVRGTTGDVIRWFGTLTDISALQEAEDALRELTANLEARVEQRTREHELAQEALRQSQKMEAIGQLTGGVAHDFNNLLTVIRGSVELLQREGLAEDKRRRYIDAIGTTTDRATKLTGQLLAFARRQALTPEPFDAGESVVEVVGILGTLLGSRITLDVHLAPEPVHVLADRGQFDTAIVNMAINARDAMAGEGGLSIAVETVESIPVIRGHAAVLDDFVAVTITDTGSGIAPEHLERIFEPFFTTKEVGAGTGLGLSQVIGFAKQSGGDIAVASTAAGTSFTLYLPRAYPEPLAAAPTHRVDAEDGEGTCVLVVEDNEQVGQFATSALRELGYDTFLAADGNQALAELEKGRGRFNIVFSDVVMPGMSGIDLAHQVREKYADMPVILTSGYSHVLAEQGTHGFELLHKPYSMEQLSRVLRRATVTA